VEAHNLEEIITKKKMTEKKMAVGVPHQMGAEVGTLCIIRMKKKKAKKNVSKKNNTIEKKMIKINNFLSV
jgi:hypothetical protein